MAPSAVTPPLTPPTTTSTTTTTELTAAGIAKSLSNTAPSLLPTTKPSPLPELSASLLKVTPATILKAIPDASSTAAQKCPTDHMITAEWTATSGWSAPHLHQYGPLSLPPTASALHYATECFEGLKLYRGHDGNLRLFRPALNAARMLKSASRVALPGFHPAELEALILALCARDGERWLPRSEPGRYLYVRPTLIGTDPDVGIKPPGAALLFVFLTTLPNLAASVAARPAPGLRLLASEDDACRAWPGGFGYAKVGANYGPSLVAQREAAARGWDQILWLFGAEGKVTEAGASNFFVVWRAEGGWLEMVTAPLEGKIILDGVTRRSVLELARERLGEELRVVEREFTMDDVKRAADQGRLVEAFACGTAYFVSPVAAVGYKWEEVRVPMSEGKSGRYAGLIKEWLESIMYGRVQHLWGVVVPEIQE